MTRRGLVLFALMSVIWGIPYLFIRIAVAEMSPEVLVLARCSIGVAILLPIALLRVDLRAVMPHWRWIVAFAAVEIAIPWFFLASAEQHISSSLAALLIAGVPLVGAVIALTGGERVTRTGLVGLLIGLAGVVATWAWIWRPPTSGRWQPSSWWSSGTRSVPRSCPVAWPASPRPA